MPRDNVNDFTVLGAVVDSVGQCRTVAAGLQDHQAAPVLD
jgi:hypothetical protein